MASEDLIAGAIVAGAGGIAATLRWAVGRVTKTLDDTTSALSKNAIDAALQTETNRTMTGKIERLTEWIAELLGAMAPACETRDAGEAQPSSRAPSQPSSRPQQRPLTQGGGGRRPITPAKGAPVVSPGLYGVRRGTDE